MGWLLFLLGLLAGVAMAGGQNPATAGTDQLSGVNGMFGTTYTVVRSDASKVNLTIVGAEYSIDPMLVDAGHSDQVDSAHKFLVIHYRVKNPSTGDLYLASENFYQAVDSHGQLYQGSGNVRRASEKHTLDLTLKAGQGADDLFTYVALPSDAVIPKLIVTYPVAGTGKTVIRFDLNQPQDHVKPLPAPYADPSDKSGAVAAPSVPATVGAPYSAGTASLTVSSIALAPGPFGDAQAGDGKQFLVVSVTVKNPLWQSLYFNGEALKPTVKTDDDKITDFSQVKAGHDEPFRDTTLDAGEAVSYRLLIPVAKDAKLKTLSLALDMGDAGVSRAFVYPLTGLKIG